MERGQVMNRPENAKEKGNQKKGDCKNEKRCSQAQETTDVGGVQRKGNPLTRPVGMHTGKPPLCKTVCRCPRKLDIELPYNPARIYPDAHGTSAFSKI